LPPPGKFKSFVLSETFAGSGRVGRFPRRSRKMRSTFWRFSASVSLITSALASRFLDHPMYRSSAVGSIVDCHWLSHMERTEHCSISNRVTHLKICQLEQDFGEEHRSCR